MLNPPPVNSPFDVNSPRPSPEWIRWVNQLYALLNGNNVTQVAYSDSSQLDAFGRLRVSINNSIFDSQQEYGLDTRLTWDAAANSTYAAMSFNGSVSNAGCSVGPRSANNRMTPITVSTVSGQSAVLQSRQYLRYTPGKSHNVLITGVFSPGTVANVDARTGYFDSNNGVFLKVTNGVTSIVMRSSTSGSVVDTAIPQSSWNIDKFDGNGPSGQNLDLTKTNILCIQAQWLGVGRVQVGFDIAGVIYFAHQFLNSNIILVPYTQTFNLPVRMELRNTGTSVGATINFNCCSVQSENGSSIQGLAFSAGYGTSSVAVTTARPILSIRPKATFNSLTNRAHIDLTNVILRATTNDAFFQLVLGGTLTGASFSSVNADSTAEFDTAASAIAGGDVIYSGYAISGTGNSALLSGAQPDFRQSLTLSQIDALTANQINLSLVATAMTGTSNLSATMNWLESYV